MVVRRVRLWFIEREVERNEHTPNEFKCPPLPGLQLRGVHDRIWLAIEFNRKYEELSKLIRDAYGRIGDTSLFQVF